MIPRKLSKGEILKDIHTPGELLLAFFGYHLKQLPQAIAWKLLCKERQLTSVSMINVCFTNHHWFKAFLRVLFSIQIYLSAAIVFKSVLSHRGCYDTSQIMFTPIKRRRIQIINVQKQFSTNIFVSKDQIFFSFSAETNNF